MPVALTSEEKRARQAAAAYLGVLLLKKEQYYRRWLPGDRLAPPQRIDQDEVARVLARKACEDEGLIFDPTDREPIRRLKDRVSRALSGKALTTETIRDFVRAFGIGREDAARLFALRAGRENSPVVKGSLDLPELATLKDPYETVLLHDCHYIGEDWQPTKHRTVQNIRSTVDLMLTYQFRFFTDAKIDFQVERGGTAGEPYPLNDTLRAIDVVLDAPLPRGETASLEFVVNFGSATAYPNYYNRGIRRAVDSLEICVVFSRAPKAAWWVEWDGYQPTSRKISEEPWPVRGTSVNRSLTYVERAVLGFCWLPS